MTKATLNDSRYRDFTGKIVFEVSNGTEVDVRVVKHIFNKKIKDLPNKEQDKCNKAYTKFRRYLGTQIANKRDRYGQTHADRAWNRSQEIIELFGKMFRVDDVRQVLNEDYEIRVSLNWLTKFRRKYEAIIAEKVDIYRNSTDSLRLTYKRSRLEELTEIFYLEKREYKINPQTIRANTMMRLMNQIRLEMEGNNININLKHEIDLRATVNEHLAREALKGISLQQLILARVCAKNHLNPLIVQTALGNGYYKKLELAIESGSLDTMNNFAYPSERTYDILEMEDQIREKEAKAIKQREDFEEAQIIAADELDPDKVREVLLEKLRKESGKADVRKNVMTLKESAAGLKSAFASHANQKTEGIKQDKANRLQKSLRKMPTGGDGGAGKQAKTVKRIIRKKRKK